MIIQFSDLQKHKEHKESVVMDFLIHYYKDLNDTGTVNIPYFIRARETYKELIHDFKDLKYYYNKLVSKYVRQL